MKRPFYSVKSFQTERIFSNKILFTINFGINITIGIKSMIQFIVIDFVIVFIRIFKTKIIYLIKKLKFKTGVIEKSGFKYITINTYAIFGFAVTIRVYTKFGCLIIDMYIYRSGPNLSFFEISECIHADKQKCYLYLLRLLYVFR